MELTKYFEPESIQIDEGAWIFWMEQPIDISASVAEQVDAFYKVAYLIACNLQMAKMYAYVEVAQMLGARLTDILPSTNASIEFLHEFIRSNYSIHKVESTETDRNGKTVRFYNTMEGIIENGKMVGAKGTQRAIK